MNWRFLLALRERISLKKKKEVRKTFVALSNSELFDALLCTVYANTYGFR